MSLAPRARRGCSHPAVDLHGRRRTLPGRLRQVVVRPPSAGGLRPTEMAHREGIRGQGFRKRVRAGKTSSESSVILTRRPRCAQRQRGRRPPRSPSRTDSARSSGRGLVARRCARHAHAHSGAPSTRARRDRRRHPRAPDRDGSRHRLRRDRRAFRRAPPRSGDHRRGPCARASRALRLARPRKRRAPQVDRRSARRCDRDGAGSEAPLRRRRRPRPASIQLSTGTASSTSTSATITAGASVGRSRAEMIWSSAASAWICARICCTRSGFSERKLVAF